MEPKGELICEGCGQYESECSCEKEDSPVPRPTEKLTYEEAKSKLRCPYRQDLEILCFSDCGKGAAVDCEIFLRYSGLLAQSINHKD